jgi:hypothetical protein
MMDRNTKRYRSSRASGSVRARSSGSGSVGVTVYNGSLKGTNTMIGAGKNAAFATDDEKTFSFLRVGRTTYPNGASAFRIQPALSKKSTAMTAQPATR